MNNHIRAHIQLTTLADINNFVNELNKDNFTNCYTLENFDGSLRVNARSIHGIIYAASDYNDEMFLVNESNDGAFPSSIDKYRV